MMGHGDRRNTGAREAMGDVRRCVGPIGVPVRPARRIVPPCHGNALAAMPRWSSSGGNVPVRWVGAMCRLGGVVAMCRSPGGRSGRSVGWGDVPARWGGGRRAVRWAGDVPARWAGEAAARWRGAICALAGWWRCARSLAWGNMPARRVGPACTLAAAGRARPPAGVTPLCRLAAAGPARPCAGVTPAPPPAGWRSAPSLPAAGGNAAIETAADPDFRSDHRMGRKTGKPRARDRRARKFPPEAWAAPRTITARTTRAWTWMKR